ncbi:YkvI family membrane protein [Ferdinandcohnia sp. Marseille-Q9671]
MFRAGIKWMFLILGTSIGAGYASGREIWQFYGEQSSLAIIFFTFIFTICCYTIMKISYKKETEHFVPVLRELVGEKIAHLYDGITILYLFSTTVVMLAGGGATLELFNIPFWWGIVLFGLLLVLVFMWNINGLVSINMIIIPALIVFLVTVLFIFLFSNEREFSFVLQEQENWPAAFTFTALNILPLVAVLGAIGKEMKSKGEALVASIGSGLFLGVITLVYNEALLDIAQEIMLYEIPLFVILKNFPYIAVFFMSILLFGAIFTTAASGILGLSTRFKEKLKMPLWMIAVLFIILMAPFTTFGFSTLVSILYPIYGIANLYLLAVILLYPIVNRYNLK